jgi:hypothetical protein
MERECLGPNMIAAKAQIRISSDKTLEGLAETLQEALSLPPFWYKSDINPPHEVTAMADCLGYEIWLWRKDSSAGEFEMAVEGTLLSDDLFSAGHADISAWFAKHVGFVTGLKCSPAESSQ